MTADHDIAAFAEAWALKLTRFRSVSGTPGEIAFAPWLVDELRSEPAFGNAEAWSFPVAEGDERRCVAMLVRGEGSRTVILTGHFDTVTVDDYGALRDLATEPEALLKALHADLAANAQTPAEMRALDDFEAGGWLPGRGLLDMKSGLAAGLAACARFAADGSAGGNLLFLTVPDEEVNSAGARGAAAALAETARKHGLHFAACINLDAIADDTSGGDVGRVIAFGTIGKLLPTAYVVGVPTHSGFPLAGLNAGALAGAIAAAVEWAPELTDDGVPGQKGTPASLLSLSDGKAGYDVTTPGTAFATFNVLSYLREPTEVLVRFEAVCKAAAEDFLGRLRERRGDGGSSIIDDVEIRVHRYEDVVEAAGARHSGNPAALRDLGSELAASDLSLPEKCRRLTTRAWELSGLSGPAIVIGFGSTPYLPTNLSQSLDARRLKAAASQLAGIAGERYGATLSVTPYFAGISDMSFFGEADEGAIDVVGRNTPGWRELVRWPESGAIAGVTTVNLGPWGRDYHTRLERLHSGYAFSVLPAMLVDLTAQLLQDEGEQT